MLTINLAAAVLVFVFTTVLTIAGVGSAFIVIPTFFWLGVPCLLYTSDAADE